MIAKFFTIMKGRIESTSTERKKKKRQMASALILQSLQHPAISKSIHFRMQLRAMIDNDENDEIIVVPPGTSIPCAFETLPILCSIVGRSIPNFAEMLWVAVTATADESLPSSIPYDDFPKLIAFLATLKPLLPATCYRCSVEPWAVDAAANGLRDRRDTMLRTNPSRYCKWAGEGVLPLGWATMRHAVLVEEVVTEVVPLATIDPTGLVAIVMAPTVMSEVAGAMGRDTTARISLARSRERIHVACEEVAIWSSCIEESQRRATAKARAPRPMTTATSTTRGHSRTARCSTPA